MPDTLEAAVALVEQSPDYRLLRRFVPRTRYADGVGTRHGLFVDVETTGLDTEAARVIELALVPFTFDPTGTIYTAGAGDGWFNDPEMPIPPEVTALTRITDEMVRGHAVNWTAVRDALRETDLVVAHNADYDRRILERHCDAFVGVPWACSFRDIDWKAYGSEGAKLGNVLAACGCFVEAQHRALDDCRIGVHVLAVPQPDGRPAFAALLANARQTMARVWAVGAPFQVKDELKARGFRWSDGQQGRPKCWYRDVPLDAIDPERVFLRGCGVTPVVVPITARDRYSVRADRL